MTTNSNPVLMVHVSDIGDPAALQVIEVEIEPHGIAIRPVGYGDKLTEDGQGSPVFIEFRNGVPFVIVWDDINNEEPSHTIPLRNAAQSNRPSENAVIEAKKDERR